MYNEDCTLVMTSVDFSGNTGGGLFNRDSSITMHDFLFINNGPFGGGIVSWMDGWSNYSITLIHGSFLQNSDNKKYGGGGLQIQGLTLPR